MGSEMVYLTNITQYFDATVEACPERIAVRDGERCITFAALYRNVLAEAGRISARLSGATGQVIAVCLPKSVEAVVADLAILYSGNAYMNLDVKSPARRTLNILQQTRPALIIAAKTDLIPEAFRDRAMDVQPDAAPELAADDKARILSLRDALIDTDLLCIINTSGSTGVPKAVALNHRSFIDFTEVVVKAGIAGREETVGSLSPTIFDIFSFELCMLMAWGATLVVLPETLAAFPARLLQRMAECHVSFIFWVPTIMVNIANMDLLAHIGLPDLRMIWFAGEVFPTAKFNYWRRRLPAARFVNLYGPIEITLDCLYYVVERELANDEPIPIGAPFQNTSILILDEADRPSREGELCIRGSSLALGYYNDPEKTRAAFAQNPLNTAYPERIYRTGDIVACNTRGELVFKGRRDTLIKHSGYRIELAEIEHVAVNQLKIVDNCCVVYDEKGKKIIMVYEAPHELPVKELRLALEALLPRYMIPGGYVHVDAMPRNPNGKIDRAMLKKNIACAP